MIRITFVYEGTEFESFSMRGHATSAPYGEDLVCAGCSAVALGGLNALEHPDDFDIKTEEGVLEVKAKTAVTLHDQTVLSTIERQLESLAFSYPKNVRLERK